MASTVWTNDSTRATALTTQDGVLVKTGATDYRYIGTIRINGTGGQCEDTEIFRGVWNFYNRTIRHFHDEEWTDHTYNGALRKWNNSDTDNLIKWVTGRVDAINIGAYTQIYSPSTKEGKTELYIDGE